MLRINEVHRIVLECYPDGAAGWIANHPVTTVVVYAANHMVISYLANKSKMMIRPGDLLRQQPRRTETLDVI